MDPGVTGRVTGKLKITSANNVQPTTIAFTSHPNFPRLNGLFYEESAKKEKRDAEGKATYGGVYLNRYDESVEKEKRDAEGKATYGGIYLNRYEETVEKE